MRAFWIFGCRDSVHAFFEDYVYAGKPMDLDRYLRWSGVRPEVSWNPAVDGKGGLLPDKRVYVWQPAGDTVLHLILTDPRSCWGKAGLHTGDAVIALNGQAIGSRAAFFGVMGGLKMGDTVEVGLREKPEAPDAPDAPGAGKVRAVRVTISGYSQPRVRLESL